MDKFNLHEWIGSGEKNLLNELSDNCKIIEENFWEFMQDNAEEIADIFVVGNFFEDNNMSSELSELKGHLENHPNWQDLEKYSDAYAECVGEYKASKRIQAFLKPYMEKSDVLSDIGLVEGENIDIVSIIKPILDKIKVQNESAIEEGDVEELQNPLKQMGKDFQSVIDAIRMIGYYFTKATNEEKKMIKDEIMKELFGKAKDRG